jgi:asparagine synthase (glutamine-hydrolysing)
VIRKMIRLAKVRFGLAGYIGIQEDQVHEYAARLGGIFERSPLSASIAWSGKGIVAVSHQHQEDARLDAGSHRLSMPQVRGCQGLVHGSFFGSSYDAALQSGQWPAAISRYLVSAYADKGIEALIGLNGAWASVIWDEDKQQAVLGRDVVGAETLYAACAGPLVAFASDLRTLQALGIACQLDEQAVAEFLHYLYVPAPRTIYQDVQAVLPGHVLIVDQSGMRQLRFAPPRFIQGAKLTDATSVKNAFTECLPRFEETLCSAAQDCLPKDGRVGLLLSGGKDSSALAIVLSQIAPKRTVCLTVGAQDFEVDESSDATILCKHLGLPHIVYTPTTQELTGGILRMVASQDQPCGDTASLPLFLALDHLPDDVNIVWDGSGNDYYCGIVAASGELGYLRRVKLQGFLPEPLWSALLFMMRLGPRRFRGTAAEWSKPVEESFVSWNGWTAHELKDLYGQEVSFSETELWRVMHAHPAHDWVALQTEVLCGIWEPHAAFRKGVLAVRAHGRAGRYPFIDNRLADLVNALPQELQFEGYTNKTLLRAYLEKYLPDELLRKPKGYFVFDPGLVLGHGGTGWLHALWQKDLLRARSGWSDRAITALLRRYEVDPGQATDKAYALGLMATWIALRDGTLT